MVKQKQSTKRNAKTQVTSTSLHGIFYHWLTAGLLAVTFYVVAVLVTALYMKTNGSLDSQGNFITSSLFVLAGLSAFWWLIESARGFMLYITRHSSNAPKKAVSKKKK